MMVMVVLGVTLNIAQIFDYHVHLQTTADCAAFSGATKQGARLNEIADINNLMVSTLDSYRRKVWRGGSPYSSYSAGRSKANSYKSSFQTFNNTQNGYQESINSVGATEARVEAAAIAKMNDSSGITYTAYPNSRNALTTLRRVVGDSQNFAFRYRSGKYIRRSSGPSVKSYVVQKATSDNTYFCGRVLKPTTEWMFPMEWMPTPIKGLRTYATAMPFAGRLWDAGKKEGRPEYEVKLVRTGDVRPVPAIPDGWGREW